MKRTAFVVGVACLLTAACGGPSSPAAPSTSDHVKAAATAPLTPIFEIGARSVDLGACLGGSGDAACFSAARFRPLVSAAVVPGAPGGLTATVNGSSVTLVWSAPTSGDPATSYSIEAGSGPGLSNLANLATNSAATTYTAASAPAGTYYVRVRATNSSGVSSVSNEVVVVVGGSTPTPGCTAAPSAPGGLTATVNGTSVTLSWSASSGSPTTYVIEAGSSPGSSSLANLDLGGTATTYTATAGNGTFYVRLRARNACGTSGASNEVTVVVGSTPAPGGSYDGSWTGTTSQGRTFNFTVSGSRVTSITYGYSVGGCSGTSTTTFNTGGTITNGSFNETTTIAAASTATFSGSFNSGASASGTMRISFTYIPFAQPCSGSATLTWTATK